MARENTIAPAPATRPMAPLRRSHLVKYRVLSKPLLVFSRVRGRRSQAREGASETPGVSGASGGANLRAIVASQSGNHLRPSLCARRATTVAPEERRLQKEPLGPSLHYPRGTVLIYRKSWTRGATLSSNHLAR